MISQEEKDSLKEKQEKFVTVMDDDFNTADGLSVIFELVREVNPMAAEPEKTTKGFLQAVLDLFNNLIGVLGLLYEKKSEDAIPEEVKSLFEKRVKAREEKNYALADKLRDEISELGYVVEETRQGSKLIPKDRRKEK